MKVDLEKDPMYDRKESPLKGIRDRHRQKFNEQRSRRFSLNTKRELDVEIVDPLPLELNKYHKEVTYSRITEKSRACQNLKKYIISQERNLKHVRLEKIVLDQDPRASSLTDHSHDIQINFLPTRDEDKQLKEINIPKIEEFFRFQTRDKLIHESRKLSKILGTRHNEIDTAIRKLKEYAPDRQERTFNEFTRDLDPDIVIEENAKKQQSLISRLEMQKKLFSNFDSGGPSNEQLIQAMVQLNGVKERRKQTLQGIRTYTIRDGDRTLKLSPPTMLLYELHKLCDQKEKKQLQLANLLKNSYQNRNDTMLDKSNFYDDKISFHDLSPQSQFKLRRVMNRKLSHRLELSKQQVHNFVNYLQQIKDDHVIINEQVIEILSQIRSSLLGGKVMKQYDLQTILKKYPKEILQGHPTATIISRLQAMMI